MSPAKPPNPQNGATNEVSQEEVEEAEEQWTYVRPLPGHAIINLGDALVKFSSGILRSNIHRVISPPGVQAEETRFSLVYFSRPEDDVMLRSLKNESKMIMEKVRKDREREGKGGEKGEEGKEEEEEVSTLR